MNFIEMVAKNIRESMKVGFLYFAMAALLFAIQLMAYMKGNVVADSMDFGGWLFFIASCVSHGATLALLPFLLFLPFGLFGKSRTGGIVMAVGVTVVSLLIFVNMQVYDIYRFHINGFVLNMVFSSAAGDIFVFDTKLYLKEAAAVVGLSAVSAALLVCAFRFRTRCTGRMAGAVCGVLVGCTLFAHVYHIYAAFMQKPSVIKCRRLIPYYFPTTSTGLLLNLGFTLPDGKTGGTEAIGNAQGDVVYPLHPLEVTAGTGRPNILMILIDSWNKRSLTPETMPAVYKYATEHEWFDNHFGCSNGTRSSIFGLFFSMSSYYWDVFESGKVSPLFIDRLLAEGYRCQVYPGADLIGPPFHRVVFHKIPDLNVRTEGRTVYDRDRRLSADFIRDMRANAKSGKPFFSFLFYDLPHSFSLPEEKLTRFRPTWTFADYTALDNDTDPTGFFNLYRHCCYETDRLIAGVLKALEDEGLADNTIVIITGDHGQEFNENGKNYWGHNGNFSKWQIGVPLICSFPGEGTGVPVRHTYRTTHYDIVPTLMRRALGVTNPPSDYSMGCLLGDSCERKWHVVGSELNYAFIVGGDTILEKTADGSLDVFDPAMNPVDGYMLDVKGFDAAIKKLNRFLK